MLSDLPLIVDLDSLFDINTIMASPQMMDLKEQINWRETKDYILLYNKLSERCFQSCVTSLYGNHLGENEISCVHACTLRYVAFNQRMMKVFLEHQQLRQRKADSPVLSPISSAMTGMPLPESTEETDTTITTPIAATEVSSPPPTIDQK